MGELPAQTGGDAERGLGHYVQYKCIDVCFSLTLPPGLFLIMFSVISMDFFGLEAVESGYLMSYFGVLQMVSEVEDKHPPPPTPLPTPLSYLLPFGHTLFQIQL